MEDERLRREKLRWGEARAISAFCTNELMGSGKYEKGSGRWW
jgi:hypothetical protein